MTDRNPRGGVDIPPEVLDYLELHHIITLGTCSFTGMPHAATIAYAERNRRTLLLHGP